MEEYTHYPRVNISRFYTFIEMELKSEQKVVSKSISS